MKRGNVEVRRVDSLDHFHDSTLHFGGCLVGEGYREDLVGAHATIFHEIGDSPGDDACLASPGAGNNQERTIRGGDGFELLRVEVFENWIVHLYRDYTNFRLEVCSPSCWF